MLSAVRLLSSADSQMLAGELDSIIHSGASVNLVRSYQSLKAVNVLGTQVYITLLLTAVRPHYIEVDYVD